jgi:hypothetical protein
VKPRDRSLGQRLEDGLTLFERERRPLPGIANPARRRTLIEQMIESIHRRRYLSIICSRPLGPRVADPMDSSFDPFKAAIVNWRAGNVDEAFWLVFLFTHFGKHPRGGWRYAREVYGRLGEGRRWDWVTISAQPTGFRSWLREHQSQLARPGAGFGNHRKYQSMSADYRSGTASVVESYVTWVAPPRTHAALFEEALTHRRDDARAAFHDLYESMDAIAGFGRTARFDYLTAVGNLGLVPIEPGSAYVRGSTGPLAGGRLLFGDDRHAALSGGDLDAWLAELDALLHIGMQVWEDALCNWQKSPDLFRPFRG